MTNFRARFINASTFCVYVFFYFVNSLPYQPYMKRINACWTLSLNDSKSHGYLTLLWTGRTTCPGAGASALSACSSCTWSPSSSSSRQGSFSERRSPGTPNRLLMLLFNHIVGKWAWVVEVLDHLPNQSVYIITFRTWAVFGPIFQSALRGDKNKFRDFFSSEHPQ